MGLSWRRKFRILPLLRAWRRVLLDCRRRAAHFEVQSIPFKWGGQHYRPADHLPYLGREEHDSDVFIATGFSTDGLVYGALAGRVISALVRKEEDASTKLLSPTRGNILKSMPNFLKENVDVGWQYLKDLPHTLGDAALDEVPNNSGKVIEHKGQKIAAYRSPDGQLKLCSAVCSHMKCIVNWNDLEKSWDCPCHGSRFDASGCLLEGPALHNLHTASGEEQ